MKQATDTTRKTLVGTVVSDAMDKTVVVQVERFIKARKYQKFYKKSKKIKAHDPENTFHIGDTVTIVETIPVSKDKSFKVIYK